MAELVQVIVLVVISFLALIHYFVFVEALGCVSADARFCLRNDTAAGVAQ